MIAPPAVNAVSDFPSAAVLAECLTALGIAFHRRGADLALKDPERRLTPALVEAVRRHKPQLLALADASAAPPASGPRAPAAPKAETMAEIKTGPKATTALDAVLALVTEAAPVSHTDIRRTLTGQGFPDGAVVEAIAEMQTRRGWIEHDLKLGYVLATAD